MEKFRAFEDPATGIMPFMPSKVLVPKNILLRIGRGLVSMTIAMIRLPLCLVVFLCMGIASFLVSLLPISLVRRPLQRFVDLLGCRILLLLLGFWWISAGWEKKNTVSAKGKAEQGWPACKKAVSGTLLISNCCSYVDLLYLSFRFSPVYAVILRDVTNPKLKGSVVQCGLFGALYDLVFFPKQNESKAVSISDLVNKSKTCGLGPLCVMPEGVSSSESAMLPFLAPIGGSPGLEHYPWIGGVTPQCHACVFRYPSRFFSPCFSSGSVMAHVSNLCCQVYNTMEVVYLAPRVTQIKAKDQGLIASDRIEGSWASQIQTAMSTAASTPKKVVRLVVPRCGVTNESAGEVMSAVSVKRRFQDALSKARG